MAKQPTPLIEIVIRDEVTAGLARARRQVEREAESWFKGIGERFGKIGDGTQLVRREFGALLGITGIGAFLGGGVVAGIAKITESLSGLARESLQGKYAAQALGVSVETMNRLTVRGMTLGLSQQEAQASIKGLTEGLLNMQTYGRKSTEWQALLKGKGGEQLGRALERAFKRGGPEEAAKLLAQQMGPMALSGQKVLRDTFHLGLGFQDMFKVDQRDLAEIYELSEPEARKYALSMANLNIQFENVKKTLAVAVMPMFERMATGLATFLQGPGGKMVKDFGTWLKGLDINWDNIAAGVSKILKAVADFFSSMAASLKAMDPVIQQIGGWKVIIGGLAVVLGTAGLAGWLGPGAGLAGSLAAIGTVAWVVPMLINTSAGAAGTDPTGGYGANEGQDTGKRLDKPGTAPPDAKGDTAQPPGAGAPYGRDRRGRAYPAPQKQSSLEDDNDPENAAPYRVAGGWQPPPGHERVRTNTGELTAAVREFKTEVAALGTMIQNMPPTDATGAGNIAGFTGVLRRLSAPMGGGGGGYRRGGGGGGGGRRGGERGRVTRGPVTIPQDDPRTTANEYLAQSRAAKIAEIESNPALKKLFFQLIENENGGGGPPSIATMEIAIARSNMLGISLWKELNSGRYGPINSGVAQRTNLTAQQWANYEKALEAVKGGSNWTKSRTDQGMRGDPNFRGPGAVPVPGTKDVFNFFGGSRGGHREASDYAAREQEKARQSGHKPVTSSTSTSTTTQQVPPATQQVPVAAPNASGAWPSPVTGTTGGQLGDPRPAYYGARTHVHQGLDIPAAHWSPVAAQMGGTVTRVWTSGSAAGNAVEVRYENGYTVRFFHLAGFGNFRQGQPVKGGDVIGFVGGTGPGGREVYSKHLHYEVRDPQGRVVNPNVVLGVDPRRPRGVPLQVGVRGPNGEPAAAPKPSPIVWSNEAEIEALKEKRSLEVIDRARDRIKLRIRVRGPRGVKTAADSTGNISPPVIERSMDPSGGRIGHSPA